MSDEVVRYRSPLIRTDQKSFVALGDPDDDDVELIYFDTEFHTEEGIRSLVREVDALLAKRR